MNAPVAPPPPSHPPSPPACVSPRETAAVHANGCVNGEEAGREPARAARPPKAPAPAAPTSSELITGRLVIELERKLRLAAEAAELSSDRDAICGEAFSDLVGEIDAASRAAAFVPSYTHFGTRLTPALPASAAAAASPVEPTALPAWLATIAATLTPDATRLPGLAAHRVSTYRDRLAAVVAAAAGGGAPKAPPGQLPPATLLVRDLMPALEPSSARAVPA